MNNNTESGDRDRTNFPANEAYKFLGSLLERLSAAYESVGLPPGEARRAALADLECDFDCLPLAA